jgi:4-hydroxy-4-methyl-2-oxoglutarate aldolase
LQESRKEQRLSAGDLLQLQRWNTPTVYNGWEQITKHDTGREGFNLEPTTDFMPRMGPMCGYAVTCVVQPGTRDHVKKKPNAWNEYRQYVASIPGPKIVVVQDLDKPMLYGAFWGEVNSSIHKALGCVGSIIDGGIRDLDEMNRASFKTLARRLAVAHAYSHPVRWNCPVEVFGRKVKPDQLIHADKHGFLVVPHEDEPRLLEAVAFMDANECQTIIPAARSVAGMSADQIQAAFAEAAQTFTAAARGKFGRKGEW